MRYRILTVLAVAGALILPALPATAARPAAPLPSNVQDCSATVENPHISRGNPLSIVSKARYKCTSKTHSVGFTFILFVCPKPPTGNESTWPNQGCVRKGYTTKTVTVAAGSTSTQYVPDIGAPTRVVRGTGSPAPISGLTTIERTTSSLSARLFHSLYEQGHGTRIDR